MSKIANDDDLVCALVYEAIKDQWVQALLVNEQEVCYCRLKSRMSQRIGVRLD